MEWNALGEINNSVGKIRNKKNNVTAIYIACTRQIVESGSHSS